MGCTVKRGGRRQFPVPLFLSALVLCAFTSGGAEGAGWNCSVIVEGQRDGSTKASVACDGKSLLDRIMAEPTETEVVGAPIVLFSAAPDFDSVVKISKRPGGEPFVLYESMFTELAGTTPSAIAPLVIEDGSEVTVSQTEFYGNRGFKYGGISMEAAPGNSASLLISGTNFVDNSKGVVNVDSVHDAKISGCTFVDNSGVSIRSSGNTALTVENTEFVITESAAKTRGIEGGGGGSLYATQCSFKGYGGGKGGGAVSWTSNDDFAAPDLTFSQCNFSQNTAMLGGGAISVAGRFNLDVHGSRFHSNMFVSSKGTGGAISVKGSGSVSISESVFQGNEGVSGGGGGAAYFDGLDGNLTVEIVDSVFESNVLSLRQEALEQEFIGLQSAGYGGAIAVTNADLFAVWGSVFLANNAMDEGGSIFIHNTKAVSILGTRIEESRATGGGGISMTKVKDTASFWDVQFIANDAGNASGGGIRISASPNVNFKNTTFEGNSAEGKGGGLAVSLDDEDEEASFLIWTTSFLLNKASEGGGMNIKGSGIGSVNMSHVVFFTNSTEIPPNTALSTLASIKHMHSVSLLHSKVTNVTGVEQGAFLVENSNVVMLSNVSFSNNGPGTGCQLISVSDTVDVVGSKFTGHQGGALSINDSGDIRIFNTEFRDNSDMDNGGAGVKLDAVGDVLMYNLTVLGNVVGSNKGGGAKIRNAGDVAMTDSKWTLNSGGKGGALHLEEVGNVDIAACRFLDNSVEILVGDLGAGDASGGAVWLSADPGNEFNFKDNNVEGCSAPGGGGGGMWVFGGDLNVTGSTFENCSAKKGGAVHAVVGQSKEPPEVVFDSMKKVAKFSRKMLGEVAVEYSTYEENIPAGHGRMANDENSGRVVIMESTFFHNDATDGGAVYVEEIAPGQERHRQESHRTNLSPNNEAWVSILQSDFKDNTASSDGGVLTLKGAGNVEIKGTAFASNVAESLGGVAFLKGRMSARITGSQFGSHNEFNEADHGTLVALCEAKLWVEQCYIVIPYTGPVEPNSVGNDEFYKIPECRDSSVEYGQNSLQFVRTDNEKEIWGMPKGLFIGLGVGLSFFVLVVLIGLVPRCCMLLFCKKKEKRELQESDSLVPVLSWQAEQTAEPD